ncbi:unnamed protein product, partial [Prorocentrum cordatum]
KEQRHAAGVCRPCVYFRTGSGCSNGSGCGFCHLPHAAKRRARPSKAVREQCKARVAMLDSEHGGGLGAGGGCKAPRGPAIRGLDQQYMRSILRARDRQRGSWQAAPGASA